MVWCRKNGLHCKDDNCIAEHLREQPECCDAILEFENTDKRFVMCELDKNHKGNHKALMFEWEGDEGITKTHSSYLHRGKLLLKTRLDKMLEDTENDKR